LLHRGDDLQLRTSPSVLCTKCNNRHNDHCTKFVLFVGVIHSINWTGSSYGMKYLQKYCRCLIGIKIFVQTIKYVRVSRAMVRVIRCTVGQTGGTLNGNTGCSSFIRQHDSDLVGFVQTSVVIATRRRSPIPVLEGVNVAVRLRCL